MTAAVVLIALGSLLFGAIVSWLVCSWRAEQRKAALKAEWNEQLAALQKSEKRTNAERKSIAAELAAVRTKLNEFRTQTATDLTVYAPMRPATSDGSDAQVDSTAPATDTDGDNRALDDGLRVAELETALADSYARRDALRSNLDSLIERSRVLAKSMAEKDEKIFTLSRELESWRQRLPPLVEKFREKDHAHTVVLEQLEAERTLNTELSNTMRTRIMPARDDARCDDDVDDIPTTSADTATSLASDNGNGRDDLKKIRGVGPVLEQKLNALGIFRLDQIANFSADDVARIAAELPQFPGRIERDRWIEQARNLMR